MRHKQVNYNSPFISVIVPVYNEESNIDNCLNSLLKQNYKKYEILVVDNNSTDNSQKKIRQLMEKNKKIKLFVEKRQGAASARNTGINKSRGEILLFIDADCIAQKDWIKRIIQPIIKNNEEVVMGFEEQIGDNYWINISQEKDIEYMNKVKNGKYINTLDGKNFAIKSETIKDIMFDPGIKIFDDFELYLKLKKARKRIRFIPDLRVKHLHKNSLKKIIINNFKRGFWVMKIYRKHKKENFKEIDKEIMFESLSLKDFFAFIGGISNQLLIKHKKGSWFVLISGVSWRLGIIVSIFQK